MNIHILGTAAAEGWPGIFCNCESCRKARRLGGKNIRTRSGLLIDDVLKVDLSPDTYHHALTYGLELYKLKYILITHSHSDHCCWGEIEYLNTIFRDGLPQATVEWYANRETLDRLARPQDWWWKDLPIKFVEVASFQTYEVGPYNVTTVKARHGGDKHSVNYLIEQAGRRFLYTCDTGIYEPPTWDFLQTSTAKPLELVICECTEGPRTASYGLHMGLPDVQVFRAKADAIGLTDANTRWILTHFTHHAALTHDELVELTGTMGFEVAYDGMKVEL